MSEPFDRARVGVRRFERYWAIALVALIGSTAPLWFPGLLPTDYPAVPLLKAFRGVPLVTLDIVSATLLGALLVVVFKPKRPPAAWWVVVGALLASFALDQQRLQPWAYQSLILAIGFATLQSSPLRWLVIVLTSSIYLFSALGKFDYQFAHTVGRDFLHATTSLIGIDSTGWTNEEQNVGAMLFPTIELLIGVGLLRKKTRVVAGFAALAMHVGLIVLLSPLVLDQSVGVLVWNAALAMTALVCFAVPMWGLDPSMIEDTQPFTVAAPAMMVVALAMPIGERWGWWDHWLSWSLYSPHTSRVQFQVHQSLIDELPPSLPILEDDDGDRWREIDLACWSLATRGVPVYPQSRYQAGVAKTLARQHHLKENIRGVFRGVADRRTGQRDEEFFLGMEELSRIKRQRYWFGI